MTGFLPTVLIVSGHDPTGGAGMQADVEAIAGCGATSAGLITATTAQNTCEFEGAFSQPLEQIRRAAVLLIDDMRFSACKTGMLASAETAEFLVELLGQMDPMPVVVDPVLRTGTGAAVADARLLEAYQRRVLALATLATPNRAEAEELTGAAEPESQARKILELGAANVLITGGDGDNGEAVDRLYLADGTMRRYAAPRLSGRFHGSGCTLSSAIAAFLARGTEMEEAVEQGRRFTRAALERSLALGRCQRHPRRIVPGTVNHS